MGVIMVPPERDKQDAADEFAVDTDHIFYESEMDDHTSPSEYGIELPAPLLVGDYANGSLYTMIPWSDGLVCGGPYKQSTPHRIMCKHELLATMRLDKMKEYFLPVDKGVEVPKRARRFVSPTIANSHRPALP